MNIYIPIPAFELVHWVLLIMYVIGIVAVWLGACFLDAVGSAMSRGNLHYGWKHLVWNTIVAVFWPISIPIIGGIGLFLNFVR